MAKHIVEIDGKLVVFKQIRAGNRIYAIEDDGGVPANHMGMSSSTPGTGGIDTYDPLLFKKKKRTVLIRRRKPKNA